MWFSALGRRIMCKAWTSFSILKTETHFHQRIKKGFCFAIKSVAVVFLHKQPIGSSLAASLFLLVCVPFPHYAFMDSTPSISKKIKTRAVRAGFQEIMNWLRGITLKQVLFPPVDLGRLYAWLVRLWVPEKKWTKGRPRGRLHSDDQVN